MRVTSIEPGLRTTSFDRRTIAMSSAIRARHLLGVLGLFTALPFFAWLPLGLLDAVPSMVEVFGIPGLRIPASATVAGLLLAAVGFHRW